MLKEDRQNQILQALQRDGKVVATELSQLLGVSEDTIRRDLRELAQAGQLQRVHGGGLPRSPVSPLFHEREHESPDVKKSIARAALSLVQDGQVIIIDGGTTPLYAAQLFPRELRAKVVTNSLPVATALSEHPHIEILVIGGRLLKPSLVSVGAETVSGLQNLRADLCLMGVCSLDIAAGISTFEYEEALVKRAMIAGSSRVAALSGREKLNTASPFIVAPISSLDVLVTEAGLPTEMLAAYRQAGIEVIEAA